MFYYVKCRVELISGAFDLIFLVIKKVQVFFPECTIAFKIFVSSGVNYNL